jgi:xanthine/uracil/vitamin C permease (AzgA family)
MAFLANMPLAVAPGMGINAYFTCATDAQQAARLCLVDQSLHHVL